MYKTYNFTHYNFAQPNYGRTKFMKIINPMICQKLLAGLAKLKRLTTTLFHSNLPTNARTTNATTKAKSIATVSAYTSRFTEGAVSAKPSTAARHPEYNADIFYKEQILKICLCF
jgi:hypothetical protein